MSRGRAAGILVTVALAGCGGRPPPASPPRPVPRPAPVAVARPDPMSEASIIADVAWLTAPERRGRGSSSPEAREVARWLEHELRDAGYQPVIQPIDRAPGQVNVIAVKEPTAAEAATVVVSAHYDHLGERDGVIYPGADDNASGVAVALAVARSIAAPDAVVPGRVVFVFTGAEEVGLFGALAYADAPVHPLDDTALSINLDMVGRRLFESAIDRDGALGAIGLEPELAPIATEVATAAGLELLSASPRMVSLIGQDWRSDDWVFRDRGVRALHLSTGLHDDYHQPTDTIDKLSRPQLVKITKFLRGMVEAVAK